MEAVENNDEPVLSTKAATEFHFYPKLPPELKLKVWAAFFEDLPGGAHCFRLTILSRDPTRLTVRPGADQQKDASAWRERCAIGPVDAYSKDALLKFNPTILYKDMSPRGDTGAQEDGVTAMVDGKKDLITFRHYYGTTRASVALLSVSAHSELFANINQIAVDVKNVNNFNFGPWSRRTGMSRVSGINRPFRCLCPAQHVPPLPPGEHCYRTICQFIRFFKDLKVFYFFVSPTKWTLEYPLDPSKSLPRELPRLCAAKGKGRLSQEGLDLFRRLQEIAQQKGLKQFHDRSGTYCEVLYEDGQDFFSWEMWALVHDLERAWSNFGRNKNWGNIEFKFLVFADLQGVTVSGDEQPLRTGRPWN
ncbi:hypothetical protein GGR58DRAFT_503441 [Xylaria digitata]|nr:hypothetical protein GGR58DRAFT_503441 [Xylaria digitata]